MCYIDGKEMGTRELEMVDVERRLGRSSIFEEITEDKIIVETNKSILPVDERNNVYQAALLLKNKYNIKTRCPRSLVKKKNYSSSSRIRRSEVRTVQLLTERINQLWNLGCSLEELRQKSRFGSRYRCSLLCLRK